MTANIYEPPAVAARIERSMVHAAAQDPFAGIESDDSRHYAGTVFETTAERAARLAALALQNVTAAL